MTVPTQPLPTISQFNSTEDPKIRAVLSELQTILTAGLDGSNLSTAFAQILGITNGANTGRGKAIIATQESVTSTSYALMPTPDRVQNIVLPTDGLIFFIYHATWLSTVGGVGRASAFLGANTILSSAGGTPANNGEALTAVTSFETLDSTSQGLLDGGNVGGYTGDVTTGQYVGRYGPNSALATVFANAGTYDLSIQFKSASGSVTAKNRKLWVWSVGF